MKLWRTNPFEKERREISERERKIAAQIEHAKRMIAEGPARAEQARKQQLEERLRQDFSRGDRARHLLNTKIAPEEEGRPRRGPVLKKKRQEQLVRLMGYLVFLALLAGLLYSLRHSLPFWSPPAP